MTLIRLILGLSFAAIMVFCLSFAMQSLLDNLHPLETIGWFVASLLAMLAMLGSMPERGEED